MGECKNQEEGWCAFVDPGPPTIRVGPRRTSRLISPETSCHFLCLRGVLILPTLCPALFERTMYVKTHPRTELRTLVKIRDMESPFSSSSCLCSQLLFSNFSSYAPSLRIFLSSSVPTSSEILKYSEHVTSTSDASSVFLCLLYLTILFNLDRLPDFYLDRTPHRSQIAPYLRFRDQGFGL